LLDYHVSYGLPLAMAYATALAVLADPTRRKVFERLRTGPRPVNALAAGLPVSRPAVSQHLKALKDAGLVEERSEGVRRIYSLRREGLMELRDWLDSFWDDALAAFNAGPEALHDLEAALAGILDCFRIGRSTLLSSLFRPRIDRILFAATKADHLHHSSHDRLEAVLRRTVAQAAARAEYAGAEIDVVALAAVRATREAQVQRGREKLPSILGTPAADTAAGGQGFDGETFDGETEVATFPGDLPEDPEELFRGEGAFRGLSSASAEKTDFRFLRFRPPQLESQDAAGPVLPHIRLDRALQFLIGDRLQ